MSRFFKAGEQFNKVDFSKRYRKMAEKEKSQNKNDENKINETSYLLNIRAEQYAFNQNKVEELFSLLWGKASAEVKNSIYDSLNVIHEENEQEGPENVKMEEILNSGDAFERLIDAIPEETLKEAVEESDKKTYSADNTSVRIDSNPENELEYIRYQGSSLEGFKQKMQQSLANCLAEYQKSPDFFDNGSEQYIKQMQREAARYLLVHGPAESDNPEYKDLEAFVNDGKKYIEDFANSDNGKALLQSYGYPQNANPPVVDSEKLYKSENVLSNFEIYMQSGGTMMPAAVITGPLADQLLRTKINDLAKEYLKNGEIDINKELENTQLFVTKANQLIDERLSNMDAEYKNGTLTRPYYNLNRESLLRVKDDPFKLQKFVESPILNGVDGCGLQQEEESFNHQLADENENINEIDRMTSGYKRIIKNMKAGPNEQALLEEIYFAYKDILVERYSEKFPDKDQIKKTELMAQKDIVMEVLKSEKERFTASRDVLCKERKARLAEELKAGVFSESYYNERIKQIDKHDNAAPLPPRFEADKPLSKTRFLLQYEKDLVEEQHYSEKDARETMAALTKDEKDEIYRRYKDRINAEKRDFFLKEYFERTNLAKEPIKEKAQAVSQEKVPNAEKIAVAEKAKQMHFAEHEVFHNEGERVFINLDEDLDAPRNKTEEEQKYDQWREKYEPQQDLETEEPMEKGEFGKPEIGFGEGERISIDLDEAPIELTDDAMFLEGDEKEYDAFVKESNEKIAMDPMKK